jgi:hypothetical protein
MLVGFNPFQTTVANGMFNTTSVGGRQGTAYADPSTVYRLRGGILAATETLPMWGGCAVYEDVPSPGGSTGPNAALGVQVGRATALTGSKAYAGFSVFDQNYAAVTTPQSPVPLVYTGGMVNTYAKGSLARIWVQADPTLVSLQGGPIGAQVSWDWVNQLLIPYVGTLTISSGTYNTTTGLAVLTMSATIGFAPGDSIVVSGLTGTGTNLADLNGTWTAIATTSGTTVTFQAPTGLGSIAITGGSLTLGSGSDVALPVTVLDIQTTNIETVVYNSVTGFASWNFSGAGCVIQL